MKTKLLIVAGFVLAIAASADRAFCVSIPSLLDNFDSYSSTSDMNAAWNEGTVGAGTLDTALGNGGNSLLHPGGVDQKRTFIPTTATDASPIIWKFDMYDDGLGNKRITGGLRDNGGTAAQTALLEMGRFNSVYNPETNSVVAGYGIRTAFLGGPANSNGWLTFAGNPAPQIGWNTFSATVGATSILWQLDFGANGSIDASRTTTISNGANRSYNVARFGGPSDVSSAGGGANFDNLSITKESSAITYRGTLTDGVAQSDIVPSRASLDDTSAARFWTFSGVQGQTVILDARRDETDLDPAMWVYEGVFTNTSQFEGGSSLGFDSSDPGFLKFADDEIPYPGGPYGDPHAAVTLTLPGTGQYTVAISNFASNPNDGGNNSFDYHIFIQTVPEPGTVSLVAWCVLAGVPRIRRNRATI